ncbi:uncharacterized protein LOC108244956 isoform X3 [Kryptolebias marmoratus]|uniref:uncharacterized protein LOC108244956 isoform X3 n=1 Tax=Kryptolebias marmoratus TaxID=37003 RepID=UPI0007F90C25|nr:uncharacterized protein LOC108244956 isoform X3 [Kryptolebias marmoratus]
MKLLLFFTAAVIMTCGSADESSADSGQDLKGKMFTLSNYGGGLVFYSPDLPPPWLSTTSYSEWTTTTTKAPTTTTTRRPPTTTWTTASPTRGVSVCLRYVSSSQDVSIFTLSPSTTPMRLATNGLDSYYLSFNDYNSVSLRTDVPWTNINLNIWTSICLTVDTVKSVVQVFNGPMMSYRKLMTYRYSWSGEPVIDFTGFEGQLTDVQVWNYPLCFKEVFYFMTYGSYGLYQGTVLSWSNIKFSIRGRTVMEDSYEQLMKQPARSPKRGGHPRWKKVLSMKKSRRTGRTMM